MGQLGKAAQWEGVEVGETRKVERMEKWKSWSGATGVGMAEPMEKAGPKEEEQRGKIESSCLRALHPKCLLTSNLTS